jgi:signal transduction histidine kinase
MRGLIQDLVRFSRESSAELPPGSVSLDDALSEALENLQAEVHSSGAAMEAESLPSVRGDRWQLTQVLQNLLSNAIKFRGDGTTPTIRVSAERRDDRWVVSVEDDGIGIPPGQEGRIFTLFQRLHPQDRYPGTGLGLALCRKIVERHGGRIWAEARPEGGSAFRFTLLDGEAGGA